MTIWSDRPNISILLCTGTSRCSVAKQERIATAETRITAYRASRGKFLCRATQASSVICSGRDKQFNRKDDNLAIPQVKEARAKRGSKAEASSGVRPIALLIGTKHGEGVLVTEEPHDPGQWTSLLVLPVIQIGWRSARKATDWQQPQGRTLYRSVILSSTSPLKPNLPGSPVALGRGNTSMSVPFALLTVIRLGTISI